MSNHKPPERERSLSALAHYAVPPTPSVSTLGRYAVPQRNKLYDLTEPTGITGQSQTSLRDLALGIIRPTTPAPVPTGLFGLGADISRYQGVPGIGPYLPLVSTELEVRRSILAKIDQRPYEPNKVWRVGLTNDRDERREYWKGKCGVSQWSDWRVRSLDEAERIERFFIDLGMQGGTGGSANPLLPAYVYAFKPLRRVVK